MGEGYSGTSEPWDETGVKTGKLGQFQTAGENQEKKKKSSTQAQTQFTPRKYLRKC